MNEKSLPKVAVGVSFGEGKGKKGRKSNEVVTKVFHIELPIQH